ncbi:unnamed protein product [Allacma fusca]|uniref:Uncharacterized protein n=1 Tax=Allacma fusca TaxID=39272 RepID=A0A8J2KKU6_9HEXA|nr:unnamed protein product [Allacma fusca]
MSGIGTECRDTKGKIRFRRVDTFKAVDKEDPQDVGTIKKMRLEEASVHKEAQILWLSQENLLVLVVWWDVTLTYNVVFEGEIIPDISRLSRLEAHFEQIMNPQDYIEQGRLPLASWGKTYVCGVEQSRPVSLKSKESIGKCCRIA